ncbi:unnamed protein product [Camellia sinensis]
MTAYDVSLTDDSWSKDVFHIIRGNTSMSWERLDVVRSTSTVLWCTSSYHIPHPTKAALQEAYSTPILPLDILVDRPPVKKFEWVI